MPELHVDIPERPAHMFEPITQQCIHQTVQRLGMSKAIEDRIYIDYGYSTVRSRVVKSLSSQFQANVLKCSVDLSLNPMNSKLNNYTFHHAPSYGLSNNDYKINKPLFLDTVHNTRVSEIFQPNTITTNYSFELTDRGSAYSLFSRITSLFGDGGLYDTVDVGYHYALPDVVLNTLFGLYKLKDDVDLSKFVPYLHHYSGNQIIPLVNRTRTNAQMAVQRTNVDVISLYEFSEDKPVERINNKKVEAYEVKLTHTVQVSLPFSLLVEYRPVIDNKLVPSELIVIDGTKPIANLENTSSVSPWGRTQDKRIHKTPTHVRFPFYDDWIVPTRAPDKQYDYHEFLTSVFLIDEEEEYQHFDILDSDAWSDVEFHPMVDHFLLLQGDESFGIDTLFKITIYEDNAPVDERRCSMDHYGNIYVKLKKKTGVYRIVFSELHNLDNLNPKWWPEIGDWFDKCKSGEYKEHCCPNLKIIDDLVRRGYHDGDNFILRRIYAYFSARERNRSERQWVPLWLEEKRPGTLKQRRR